MSAWVNSTKTPAYEQGAMLSSGSTDGFLIHNDASGNGRCKYGAYNGSYNYILSTATFSLKNTHIIINNKSFTTAFCSISILVKSHTTLSHI